MTSSLSISDHGLKEKLRAFEDAQRATLNILEDFSEEKRLLETVTRATVNILEDFGEEKARFEMTQRATFNILDDFSSERARLEETQRALLNLLTDFDEEKTELRNMPRAMQNIMEDLEIEKVKVEIAYGQLTAETLERKRAEGTTVRVNEELKHRAAELEATNKELEAFTYSVSHDLRAPLRHMDGFSKILMEEFAEHVDPKARKYLERIRTGTQQMGHLVDDLLNLARLSRREVTLQVSGLNSIVQEVLSDLTPETADRQIDWQIGKLPFVECDAALIKQVFANLLSNAVKYTRFRECAVIEVATISENGQRAVFVRDNGVGFNMKYADKLFGVFQRLHRAEDFEGTGVGLAIVQRIIHKHGGKVWADAELDKGATFYFSLGSTESISLETTKVQGGEP